MFLDQSIAKVIADSGAGQHRMVTSVARRHTRGSNIMEHETCFVDEMERDDSWLKAHMEDIVDQYAHKVIAILDQSIVSVGDSIVEVQKLVAVKHPKRIPLIFEVPRSEEFECLL